MKRLSCILWCTFALWVAAAPVAAQSYVPPQRNIRFQITGATPMKTPYCDKVRPYVKLTMSRGTTELATTGDLILPHSDYDKGGISGWSASGVPICPGPGQHFENFGSGPFVEFGEFSCSSRVVTFRVRLYDEDDGADDLTIDHSFTIDFSSPAAMNQLTGCKDEGEDGKVCWEITFDEPDLTLDSDFDGLTDIEETRGVDNDCDGQLVPGNDLFLNEMGVNPNHKDMLIEMNWFQGDFAPSVDDIQDLKDIFARAPVGAGGHDNPDGKEGINLIVDAGALFSDVGVHELGGRDLGASALAPTSGSELQTYVSTIEVAHRIGYFRNIVFGPLYNNGMPATGVAGRAVGNDRIQIEVPEAGVMFHELGHSLGLLHGGERPMAPGSSWPEMRLLDLDGDSVPDRADLDGDGVPDAFAVDLDWDSFRDAWGFDDDGDGQPDRLDRFEAGQNCKPNHLSSMNYLYGEGIAWQTTGGVVQFFDDFSPSKIPDHLVAAVAPSPPGCPTDNVHCNMRISLLPQIDETQLQETHPLMPPGDVDVGLVYRHVLQFYDAAGKRVVGTWIDQPQDWDNDPSTVYQAPLFYSNNVDVDGNATHAQACTAANNGERLRLSNLDEWSKIHIPPVRGAAGEGLAQDLTFEDRHAPFSRENRAKWRAEILTTDLSVAAHLAPEYATTGESAVLVVEVANQGPGPASDGWLSVQLPGGVTASTVPESCLAQGNGRYDCSTAVQRDFGRNTAMPAGAHRQFEFVLAISPNATGGQRDILVQVSHGGPELNYADNSAVVPLVANPGLLSFDDDDRPWLVSWSGGAAATTSTQQKTHGNRSLRVSCGNQQLESPSFDTAELELLGDELVMDVLVSTPQNPWYVGNVQAFLDVPSGNLWNLHIGMVDLKSLTLDTWQPARFALSAQMQDVLARDFPDARIRLEINVASCASPVYIDQLRFEGNLRLRDLWHPSARLNVEVSSVLSFDVLADWSVSGGSATVATETEEELSGSAALAVAVQNWARVESREFATDELVGVTSRLALDVYIPDLPADYYWLGQVNAFLSCPEAGLYNEYLGYQPLQILFDDEYNQIVFELSPRALTTLATPGQTCRFAFELAANGNYGPFLLDNAGFVSTP